MVIERRCFGGFARFMRRRGWGGVTLPMPGRVLILYWGEPSHDLRRHEWGHVMQARRYGWAGWWRRYIVGLLRYGYRGHPMELEADAY